MPGSAAAEAFSPGTPCCYRGFAPALSSLEGGLWKLRLQCSAVLRGLPGPLERSDGPAQATEALSQHSLEAATGEGDPGIV